MRSILTSLCVLGSVAIAGPAHTAPTPYKIVTASERGTYIQIGRDIGKFVAPAANIDLEVLPSAGSVENVRRLRYDAGVKFALVQSDVYQAYLDQSLGGNAEAGALIKPLRVIMPLYNEEMYFVTRADAKMNFVHDIKGAKINIGARQSGTAMSATTIYRLMFAENLPEANSSSFSNEEALAKLIGDKSVDVVVVIAGQPAKLFVDMKPEARRLIKFLKFDPANRAGAAALKTYFPVTIRASNYPNLLSEDIAGVAAKAFLVTYDYKTGDSVNRLTAFSQSLCDNFSRLQAEGHPKWQEVRLALPNLGQGWLYYPPMERTLRACIAAKAREKPVKVCTQEERILGTCS